MNRLSLSERILEERIRNHLTQEELACRLGVSKAAVSKWE
ncbi:MAG: helix-turn-helix transcriptional regulator [Adlercreutzia mucosicola]|nr:helix-turn-helix transcriptional regulator [Adlercreutzia mucosicola]